MQNAQAGRVLGLIAGVFGGIVVLAALRGGFDFAKHETDMLHLVDLVLRLEGGAKLHEDVMTPLGLWGLLPSSLRHTWNLRRSRLPSRRNSRTRRTCRQRTPCHPHPALP